MRRPEVVVMQPRRMESFETGPIPWASKTKQRGFTDGEYATLPEGDSGRNLIAIGWPDVSREDTKKPQSTSERREGHYANVFQIGHNAFEVLVEFGQHEGGIHTRIFMSPQHARILSDLLVDT